MSGCNRDLVGSYWTSLLFSSLHFYSTLQTYHLPKGHLNVRFPTCTTTERAKCVFDRIYCTQNVFKNINPKRVFSWTEIHFCKCFSEIFATILPEQILRCKVELSCPTLHEQNVWKKTCLLWFRWDLPILKLSFFSFRLALFQ